METWAITGISRGIGHALCVAHLRRGGQVVGIHRAAPSHELLILKDEFQSSLTLVEWDVRQAAPNMSKRLPKHHAIDVLIANAATYGPRAPSFERLDYEGALNAFNTNALGFLRSVEAFQDKLLQAEHPRIIALSSLMGTPLKAGASDLPYRMSKAALHSAVLGVAKTYEPTPATVCCVRPGWVRTRMGGDNGTISTSESAATIIKTVDQLAPAQNAAFLDLDGSPLTW